LLALYRQHVTSRSRSPPRPRMVQLPRWRADGASNGRLAPLIRSRIRSRWDAGPWLVQLRVSCWHMMTARLQDEERCMATIPPLLVSEAERVELESRGGAHATRQPAGKP